MKIKIKKKSIFAIKHNIKKANKKGIALSAKKRFIYKTVIKDKRDRYFIAMCKYENDKKNDGPWRASSKLKRNLEILKYCGYYGLTVSVTTICAGAILPAVVLFVSSTALSTAGKTVPAVAKAIQEVKRLAYNRRLKKDKKLEDLEKTF